jgi:hypothetical protein
MVKLLKTECNLIKTLEKHLETPTKRAIQLFRRQDFLEGVSVGFDISPI